jgi:hypothetical protein
MYTLVRSMPLKQLLIEQLPTLIVAIIIAELFYKFHSFTLEALAFLATWFVVDALYRIIAQAVGQQKNNP